uniref:Uncharacterized protein n=1 Tax=Panagrolaimus sp. JU765 TaxID=591449 RepID=A0AC34RQV6_9BILA
MKIECPTTQIVADLPPIKLDYLKIFKIGEWLDFLTNKSFSCEFSKLDISEANAYLLYKWKSGNISTIDYIKEITVKMDSVDETVFEQLHAYFPNAKKLIVFCDDKDDPMDENYNAEFQELDGWWKEIKEIIEDAPQSEIVLNYNYDTYFKKEYREITAKLGGQKIDDKTLRWTSNKNKSKIINFQHELKIGVRYKYFADSTDSESEARSELFCYESDHELDWLFESDDDDWSSTDDYSDAEIE